MVRRRANPGDVERLLLDTAAQDGKRVRIGFGQDPGQAGKAQALHLVRALSGFTVRPKVAKLAALMDETETDVLAFLSFPKDHRRRSTRPIRWNG